MDTLKGSCCDVPGRVFEPVKGMPMFGHVRQPDPIHPFRLARGRSQDNAIGLAPESGPEGPHARGAIGLTGPSSDPAPVLGGPRRARRVHAGSPSSPERRGGTRAPLTGRGPSPVVGAAAASPSLSVGAHGRKGG